MQLNHTVRMCVGRNDFDPYTASHIGVVPIETCSVTTLVPPIIRCTQVSYIHCVINNHFISHNSILLYIHTFFFISVEIYFQTRLKKAPFNETRQCNKIIYIFNKTIFVKYRNKQGLKKMLFNETRQYNIQIFNKDISEVKDKTNQSYKNKV